jgi:hypothetical protein
VSDRRGADQEDHRRGTLPSRAHPDREGDGGDGEHVEQQVRGVTDRGERDERRGRQSHSHRDGDPPTFAGARDREGRPRRADRDGEYRRVHASEVQGGRARDVTEDAGDDGVTGPLPERLQRVQADVVHHPRAEDVAGCVDPVGEPRRIVEVGLQVDAPDDRDERHEKEPRQDRPDPAPAADRPARGVSALRRCAHRSQVWMMTLRKFQP